MRILLAMVMILAVGTPLAFGEVYVQNDRQYIGDDGSLHIVGEIRNDLQVPLNQMTVHVTLLDESGNPITTEETGSLVNIMMPGMVSPFDLILTGSIAGEARSYLLDLDYRVAPPKNQVIDITSSEISRDGQDNLMITGIVTNRGDITANTVAVIATLYDDNGNVAAVSRINPEPDYLRADGDAFFLVSVPDKIQTSGVSRYALVAESEEYAAVPEFPVGVTVLLVIALSACIMVTRYSGRVFIEGRNFAAYPA